MVRRKCLDCPRIIAAGSRCPACRERYRSSASRHALPRAIKALDGGRCRHCGATERLKMHHIVPLARGGTDDPANLITLFHDCHERAHHGG